jgi:uncharacterized RDD family membrane protein YckC
LVATAASGAVAERVGFFPRFIATLIDGVIIYVIQIVLGFVLDPGTVGAIAGVLALLYFAYFWSTTGQTVGHMVMKLRVVRVDGAPLSVGTGVMRMVGFIVSEIPLFLGLLWVLWDANKQGWHDKIAGTCVVKA